MRLDLEKDHDPGDDVTKGIDYPTQLKGRFTSRAGSDPITLMAFC
jgi:hypothetical protein